MSWSEGGTEPRVDLPVAKAGRRPRVQQAVVARLAREIAVGRYAALPGLPRESDLGAAFGVSRTVIREALKILESKGMVRARPRVGTVVLERSEWKILDPDLVDWIGAEVVDFDFLEALLEVRRAIEPVVAELAAERASLQDIAQLDGHWQRMVAALPDDLPAFAEADVAFHATLFRASRNPVFTQLSGVVHWAMKRLFLAESAAATSHEGALALHHAVIEALRLRDRAAARQAALGILAGAERDLAAARLKAGRVPA